MADPIYTYTALGFIIGVIVGITLCNDMLRRANRALDDAIARLNRANDRHKQATEFYQASIRASEKIRDALRRLDGERS